MKKLNDKKISVLAATALTVSLVMPTVQMIPAEEREVLDQYKPSDRDRRKKCGCAGDRKLF